MAHKLKPIAILVTHGHLDHTFSILPLQADCGIDEVIIGSEDRDLLARPERALGPQGLGLLDELKTKLGFSNFVEPNGVREVIDGDTLLIGEMRVMITLTPGHTPGSIIAQIDDELLITGDTLFAGSIGRTDLPRGSISDMEKSLREKIAPMNRELSILPGHGERSHLSIELENNPFLRAAIEGRLR